MEQFVTNAGDKLKVHNKADCNGPVCPIHLPTPHHMREWKLIWRADRGIFERLCPTHGTGHPDPDDLTSRFFNSRIADGVHGCCGCCNKGIVPGMRVGGYSLCGHAYVEGTFLPDSRIEFPNGLSYGVYYPSLIALESREYTMVDLDPDLR